MPRKLKFDIVKVTSSTPRNGKTTVVEYLSKETELPYCSTSSIVAEEMIKRYVDDFPGLTVEKIITDRKIDPEKYRAQLIETGLNLNKYGLFPSVFALARGFNIIEGARVPQELIGLRNACKMNFLSLCHIHIVRDMKEKTVKDSTQSEKLFALADHIVYNEGTVEELYQIIDQLVF